SVHSMMSMNCFLRKSMIAIACQFSGGGGAEGLGDARTRERRCEEAPLLLRRGEPRRLGLALPDFRLEALCRKGPRNDRPVGEDERWRGGDLHLLPERARGGQRSVAVAVVGRQLAGREECVPRLHVVG